MDTYTLKIIIFILIISTLKLSAQNDTLSDSESVLKDSSIIDNINILKINYFDLGKRDAKIHYKKFTPYCIGAISGCALPFGLWNILSGGAWSQIYFLYITPVTIITQAIPSKLNNPINPYNQLFKNNEEYYKGYKRGVYNIKSRKFIIGFGYGLIIAVETIGMIMLLDYLANSGG